MSAAAVARVETTTYSRGAAAAGAASTMARRTALTSASSREPQDAGGVVVVDLLQDRLRQAQAVDPPASLGRDGRGRVIEVLVLRLQEPVVDLVERIVEDLLRVVVAVRRRHRVRAEEDAVLVLLEELPRRARLPAQLADAGPDLDRRVRELVQGLAHEGEVLRVVPDVEEHELGAGMAGEHAVTRGHDLGEGREIVVVEGPVGMMAELVVA